jgi:UDP-N-acetylmuramoyl-tripeptide--D-alanyl-D-alanine ligase
MTPLWSAADLAAATSGRFTRPFAATGISIDSRSLQSGDLFVALQGDSGDGHDHVAAALAHGAAGAMVHRMPPALPQNAPVLHVGETLDGLIDLGRFARRRFAGRTVAITGSVGKTTTKEMLRTILADQTRVHAAAASHNNHWGVPLTLARLPADAGTCVVEIGMNHAGEIAPLARLARPDAAVITSIAPAHIGHLGSIEAIADEKARIFEGVVAGGSAVLPADSPWLDRLRAQAVHLRVMTFGTRGDAAMVSLQLRADGSDIVADIAGVRVEFHLPAPGPHMAQDALAALAAAVALGFDATRAATSLASFTPVTGRGAQRRLGVAGGDLLLLDESYNASSAAVRAALGVLRLQPGRRIAVLGDMLELGTAGPAEHVGLAEAICSSADLLFTCGPLMRHLFDAVPVALQGGHAPDAATLAPTVARAVAAGDAVLVKGSLGSRMRLVVAALEAGSG